MSKRRLGRIERVWAWAWAHVKEANDRIDINGGWNMNSQSHDIIKGKIFSIVLN